MSKISEIVGGFRNWLAGKKTYLVCAAAIIAVAMVWSEGEMSHLEALQTLFQAVFGITIRAAVAKVFQ